jgi:hypothetical protein
MAPITTPSHLANSLATSAQLEASASQLDGLPRELDDAVRYETLRLTQAAGILLRLPQEIIAQSIVVLQRYWVGRDSGSMFDCDPKVRHEALHDRSKILEIMLLRKDRILPRPLFMCRPSRPVTA